MPELPDVSLYIEALQSHFGGHPIQSVTIRSPFILRTLAPTPDDLVGRQIVSIRRLGKQIAWILDSGHVVLFHLMITGRFHVRKAGTRPRGKNDLVAFGFSERTLMLTEASQKKRAAMWILPDESSLAEFDRGGLEILDCRVSEFAARLREENRTLKRALTDPRKFSGIGNAYSDEILHAARLSPVQRTKNLTDDEIEALHQATQDVMRHWIALLANQAKGKFPERVTAFRPEMAVHGKYGEPCPDCSVKVQRIVFADNELNYCPRCQTGDRVLADRSLSRLLKQDWPSHIDDWE